MSTPALLIDLGSTGAAVEFDSPTRQALTTLPSDASSSVRVWEGKSVVVAGPGRQSGSLRTAVAVLTVDRACNCWLMRLIREDCMASYVTTSEIRTPMTTSDMTPIRSRPSRDWVMD